MEGSLRSNQNGSRFDHGNLAGTQPRGPDRYCEAALCRLLHSWHSTGCPIHSLDEGHQRGDLLHQGLEGSVLPAGLWGAVDVPQPLTDALVVRCIVVGRMGHVGLATPVMDSTQAWVNGR